MIKINLVNESWDILSTRKVKKVPRIGEYIYDRSNSEYLIVKMVIHDYWEGVFATNNKISLVVENVKNS